MNFTGNTCARASFNKIPGLRPATLFKKILLHRCFPLKSAKILRTSFLYNTSERLLLIFSLLKMQAGLQFHQKKETIGGLFQMNFNNFLEHLFIKHLRTTTSELYFSIVFCVKNWSKVKLKFDCVYIIISKNS